MKKLALALAAIVSATTPALAQNAITQNGSIVARHLGLFQRDRTLGDVGGLTGATSGPFIGYGAAPFSITDNNGLGLCYLSAVTTGSYHSFCFGHNSSGDPVYSLDGTSFSFPGAGNGNASMPESPAITAGHIPQANGGTTLVDGGIAVEATGRLRVPYDAATGSTNDEQFTSKLTVTDALTKPRYAVLGLAHFAPTSGSPWSSTVEGVIGLAYMQGAGTHSGFVFGVGGTGFVCEPSEGGCPAATAANLSGVGAGVYGSFENNGAGLVNVMASVWADGADNLIGAGGTATHNTAIYVTSPTVGTIKKGIWFAGTAPAYGSIAADQDLTVRVGAVNAAIFQNDAAACGAQIYSTALGGFFQGYGTNCNAQVLGKGTGDVILTGDTGNIYAKPPVGRAFYVQNDAATCGSSLTSNANTVFFAGAIGTNCGVQLTAIGTGAITMTTAATSGLILSTSQMVAYGPGVALTASFPAIKRSATETQFRLADDSADAPVKMSKLTVSDGTQMMVSSAAFTDGAGAGAGTLTNAPAAGDPTKWIAINDNGTVRHIPAW